MKFSHALFTFLILLLSAGSQAQIVDRTKDRAEDKTNDRIDRRVDQGIDKSLDAIEGIFKRKNKDKAGDDESSEDASQAAMSSLFGGGDVDLEPSYSFDHRVDMDVTVTDKKGKESTNMQMAMYFSDDTPQVGMHMAQEGAETEMILDVEKTQMVMLMNANGQKIAFATSFDPAVTAVDEEDTSFDASKLRKTGRTKEILGYTCEEYIYEDEDVTSTMWVTEEGDLDIYQGLQAMGSQKQSKASMPEGYPQGMCLEMESTDKSGSVTHMLVTAINKDIEHTISTEGYQVMGMPGGE